MQNYGIFLTSKTYTVMKLTAMIMLVACLQVSARGYTQERVTLSQKDAPLTSVLDEIEKQTGYHYFMNAQWETDAKKVSVEVSNADLKTVLDICFKDQPFSYQIVGKTIVIKQKDSVNISSAPAAIDGGGDTLFHVKGIITDDEGNPLIGASIRVRGREKGISTNAKGEFNLNGVGPNSTLEISFVGFESQVLKVSSKTTLTLQLKKSQSQLDAVQVIPYGTTTQRLSTGNVSIVTAKEIEEQPVSNPLLALEGRVPGLFITQSTGVPGSGVSVTIQGLNSLNSGTDPLYVIDGVPYNSQLLPNLSGPAGILGSNGNNNQNAQWGGGSPLSYINPGDIESIDVLKDADATAIYGSRAANGAILITTKKGKAGKTKVDINVQNGWGKVTRSLHLLNTRQYLEMRHEAFKNDGTNPGPTDYDINGTWDTTRNTDWQKLLIGGTAQYMNAQASISGGTTNTQFLVGTGYHRETTVFPGDLADQKGSLHFNITNISTNKKFHFQLSGSYMVDNNRLVQLDLTNPALTLPPDAPPMYNGSGSLNWALSNGSATWLNPLSAFYNNYTNTTKNLVNNAMISYEIITGLEIKSSFGYTDMQVNEVALDPLIAVPPDFQSFIPRISQFSNSTNSSWIIEPQLSYNHMIGEGSIQALVGSTVQQNNSNVQQFYGIGYNSDLNLQDISAAALVEPGVSLISVYHYNALFGRINYNWKDRYIINLTARRDGSSRFGPQSEFHDFGAAGASWIFSQEQFIKRTLSFLSFGKLRGSYGTTGNDQIGDYKFLSLYNPVSVPVAYQGSSGILPGSLPNPYLEWELTKKLQFGLDLGFLKDRILFNANYYLNRSSNLLSQYALPYITGNSAIQQNFPATIQNTGWEFSVHTKNIEGKNFVWTSSISLTLPGNELKAFPGLATSSYANQYLIGEPITIKKTFLLLGVNPTTGLYSYADSHGNTTSSPQYPSDATSLINTDPKFYGGFQNSFSYKRIELNFLFHFVRQISKNYFFGGKPGSFYSSGFGAIGNQPSWVLDRWQEPGDVKSVQQFSAGYPPNVAAAYGSVGNSASAFSDASYIRLKNVSLSWQLPEKWTKNARLEYLRLYAQGQNLFTITRFRGMDPENNSLTALPPLKVLTFGIQVGL